MEIYIVDGRELTLEQFEALAKEAGLSTEQYKALYNVEVKQDPNALDAAAGEDTASLSLESQLETTKSEWEKYRKSQLLNKEGKYDPNLIADPNHRMPDGGQNYINKRNKFIIKEKELNNKITARNTDPNQLKNLTLDQAVLNPDRILLQNEDDIVNWLKETVPFYNPQAGGTAGNSVTIAGKELDLTELFKPSKRQKEKAIQILTELADAKKLKTDSEIIGITASQLGKSVERNPNDLTGVNALLTQNTPYELVEDPLSLKSYDEFSQDIVKKYNVLKNGKLITTLPASDLDDFFKQNITEEEFKKISKRSFDAVKTYSALKDAENYQNRIEIKDNPNTNIEYFKNNFETDLINVMKENNFLETDIEEVQNYLKQQIKSNTTRLASIGPAAQYGITNNAIDYKAVAKSYSTLEGLNPELKDRLIRAGINNQTLSQLTEKGIDRLIDSKISEGEDTILGDILMEKGEKYLLNLASYYNKNALEIAGSSEQIDIDVLDLDGNLQEQIDLAGTFKNTDEFLVERSFKKDDTKAVAAVDEYIPLFDSVYEEINSIAKELPKNYYISLEETPSGPLLAIIDGSGEDKENKKVSSLSSKLAAAQSTLHNLNRDRNVAINKINNNRDAFYNSLSKRKQYDDVINAARREYGLGNLFIKDVNDAVSSLLLTVPTIFESEWAIGKQKQLNSKNNYYKAMTGPEFSLEYVTRTLGQQSANIALAIATAGGGGAIGLQARGISNAIGLSFGMTSGTQTFRDLNIQVDAVEAAKNQAKIYKAAYEADPPLISEYDYTMAMRDINKTIAMGDLTDNQILNASMSNGLIEGVFTKYLGTAPNTIKLLKDFSTVNRKLIAEQLFKGNLSKVTSFIGKPIASRTGFEVIEELSIFGGQQFFTEAGILGRDIDKDRFFKGANETFWATVVTAGLSQSTGIAYSGMNAYGLTKKYEKELNSKRFNINSLSKTMQNLKFNELSIDTQKALLTDIGNEMKEMGLVVDQNSIDMLNLGATEINRLIGTQLIKQDYLRSFNILPGTTAQIGSAIQAKKKTMTTEQAEDFDNVLSSLDTQINNIKEAAGKKSNYDTAKDALGNLTKSYEVALKNDLEYKNKSTKDKLVYIINKAREDFRKSSINKAKSIVGEKVESLRINKAGEFTTDKRSRKLTDKEKDKLYAYYGDNLALTSSRGFSTKIGINISAKKILGDLKDVRVLEWTDDAKGIELLLNNGFEVGTEEFANTLNKLQEGTYGLVNNKTIFTQNKEQVDKDLANGELGAGTVILHELNHIIDDARMKSTEARNKYFNNLFEAASSSNNINLNAIHNRTVKALDLIYNGERNATWQDEYTKWLQEELYAYEDQVKIEKDDNFITKLLNSTDPNNLDTPEKALNYLAASNSAFRRGKVSKSTKRDVAEFKGNNVKESSKNINDLARDYKALPVDQRASFLLDTDFYRQYLNTSLAAMGFNVSKGDIATEQAEGFAVDAFDRVTRSYKPEDGSFTNWIYSTVGREGRAKIGEEIERKKGLVRQSQAQEQTKLVAKETAEDAVSLEERKKSEGKGETKFDPRKFPGVPANIDNLIEVNKNEVVINPESRSYTTDFRSISDKYGSKVAGEIYNIKPDKLKKGADLTYGQNKIVDGRKVVSEAERIQRDYSNVQDAKRLISLFPEFNISTPTAVTTEQGQETKVDKEVQGRALGIAPSVQNYFYEDYIDPRALNKETKKDAITNPKGRSKGTTSQTQVRRLKPEFRGTISNETIAGVQKKLGITSKGEFNVPPKGKARTEFGRLLIGLANLKGAIVANTVVDQKIQSLIKKGEIKSSKTGAEITANTRAGRKGTQLSEKRQSILLQQSANNSFNVDKNGKPLFVPPNIKLKRSAIIESRGLTYIPNKKTPPKFKTDEERRIWTAEQEARKDKLYSTIDRDAVLPNNATDIKGEKVFEGLVRVVNDFLDINPEWNNAIRYSTTNSAERNTFISNPVYKKFIQSPKGKQKGGRLPLLTGKQYSKGTKFNDSFEDRFNSNGYLKDAEQKIDDLKDFGLAVQEYLKDNPKAAWVFAAIAKDGQNNQNSIFRYSAPQLFAAIDSNGKFSVKPMIEEHSMPQNNIGTSLVDSAIKGRIEQDFPVLKASFMQGALTYDDNNLVDVNYKFTMPDIYWEQVVPLLINGKLKLPMGLASMIRYTESNVDLNSIVYKTKINGSETVVNLGDYFFGNQVTPVALQKELIKDYFTGKITKADVKKKAKFAQDVKQKVDSVFKPNAAVVINKDNVADKAMADARDSAKYSEKRKGISVFDFDDTLAQSNSNVLYTMPDGTTGSLTAGEFALEASYLGKNGAKFDFSEFNEVKEGRKGPLADLALKRQKKFGSQDIFVLTARPQSAAINIKKFLDEIGLNIPLANITGLENGTAEAKAEWMIGKYADGYNDFYFADDAFKNVEAVRNVFDVLDIKSKVQQARVKFSEKIDKDFNDMIERNMGVPSEATYSDIVARRMGKNQKRFSFFIPPSADDFRGLTMYTFAGKGKQGEADQEFFNKALIKPYMAGVNAMNLSKNRVKSAYKVLQQTSPKVRKKLNKKIGGTKYTHDAAIRIYLWNKDGTAIPGLSKRDQEQIVKLVEADTDLVAYAEGVKLITKQDVYLPPSEFWDGTTIIGDLSKLTKDVKREEYLKDFSRNVDIIFSPKNLNKVEAIYGFRVREALENIIYRMKTGSNRKAGADRIVTAWNDWTNRSVGAIMFFNRRSALLQMLSAGNFVNWSDNNPAKAALAFANQPQYWKDVVYLFNSPKLKARRSGLEGDINEAEIAQASKKGGMEGVLSYLLKIGFTPTQIADSIAISTGGASFYRNRINTYKKEGYTVEDAEKKAFDDFSAISDETQQSADPMLISMQQAGTMGRLILAFQNTPMQYTRLMKKAGQDIINGRGDFKTNFSKILYYGFIQNLIFSTLQNAMFALLPGFDDEEEPDFKTDKERDEWLAKQDRKVDNKTTRVVNNMLDTLLRGSGLAGAVVSTTKNVIMEYVDRQDMSILEKSRNNADLLIALSSISPPISSKLRKINNALNLEDFEKDIIAERGFSVTIDGRFQLSPQYQVIGEVASGLFNLPLDRVFNEVNSITEALDERNNAYQRIALGLGWKTWDVGAKIEEHELIKTTARAKRKEEGIEKGKVTRKTNKELEKEHERLRRSIIFKLPKPIKDSLIRKEREDKKITAIYKLNQLKAKYLE